MSTRTFCVTSSYQHDYAPEIINFNCHHSVWTALNLIQLDKPPSTQQFSLTISAQKRCKSKNQEAEASAREKGEKNSDRRNSIKNVFAFNWREYFMNLHFIVARREMFMQF